MPLLQAMATKAARLGVVPAIIQSLPIPPKREYHETSPKIPESISALFFLRQVPATLKNVCGGSTDGWVQELMHCFDSGECGHAQPRWWMHSSQNPASEPTEAAPSDTATTSQTYLPSTLQRTQQPTLWKEHCPWTASSSPPMKLPLTLQATVWGRA